MKLDRAVGLAIILLCLAIIADLVVRHFFPGASPGTRAMTSSVAGASPARPARPQYQVGEAFQPLPGLSPERGMASLLFVVREGCRYCENSIPFYQRVATAARAARAKVKLVGICPSTTAACQRYFESSDVRMDEAVGIQSKGLKVAGTPTIVMIDEGGRIEGVWAGELPIEREMEVLGAIKKRTAEQ
jgi:hypothetical protein